MLGGLFSVYEIKLSKRVTKITSEKTGKKEVEMISINLANGFVPLLVGVVDQISLKINEAIYD